MYHQLQKAYEVIKVFANLGQKSTWITIQMILGELQGELQQDVEESFVSGIMSGLAWGRKVRTAEFEQGKTSYALPERDNLKESLTPEEFFKQFGIWV